jgi:allantoin racemase
MVYGLDLKEDPLRIDVVHLISGVDQKTLTQRGEMLQRLASPGTEVRVVQTSHAPPSVESEAEMELAAPGILERVVRSEQDGADAVVIWGGHDPSLAAARELVTIPVIGPGMASMYLASALSNQFSLIIQLSNVMGIARRQVRELGLENRCASIRSVEIPVLELLKKESFAAVKETAISAIDEDGADAVCFGCMALVGHTESLSRALAKSHPGILVIHPGQAVLLLAELFVKMGISHSKRSYPPPLKKISFF